MKYTKKEIVTIGAFSVGAIIFLIIISTIGLLREILSVFQKTLFLMKIIFGIILIPFVLSTSSRHTKKLF